MAFRRKFCGAPGVCLLFAGAVLCAGEPGSLESRLQSLQEENARLRRQVEAQQQAIDDIGRQLAELKAADARRADELRGLDRRVAEAAQPEVQPTAPAGPGRIILSGEAGLAFFSSDSEGAFPNAAFRVDDARIFVEAEVMRDVYAFAGLDLFTRETPDEAFHLNEFYVEFENFSRLWGRERQMTLRAGRIAIPFGEEYQKRGVMENPLITHSASDIWGIDEGVEVFGSAGGFDYVLAVQNGNHRLLNDYNEDKALVFRLGTSPAPGWRLSASAMRTGDLDPASDGFSEAWFGGGFFRALGQSATTHTYGARLFGLDASYTWDNGHAKAAAGQVRFDDDDSAADNSRRIRYWSLEAVQDFSSRLYAAARYSGIRAPRGYPVVGLGDFGDFFFRKPMTTDLWRLSLGLGYRFGPPLIWKVDYSFEGGTLTNGQSRNHEDLLSTEVGLRF